MKLKTLQNIDGILGIDPSLKGTGYCFSENDYGVIKFSGHNTGLDLSKINDQIEDIIIKNKIKYAFKEGYAYAYFNQGVTRVMEVGGVLKRLFHVHNVQLIDVAPTSLKFLLTGTGKGKKEGVQRVITSLLHKEIEDDNMTDALGLYLIGGGYQYAIQKTGKPFGTKIPELNNEIEEYIAYLLENN